MPQRISGNVKTPLQWSVVFQQTGGFNTYSATKGASTGVVHVANAVSVAFQSPTNTPNWCVWQLLDGVTVIMTGVLTSGESGSPSGASSPAGDHFELSGLNLPGTAGNAMTLQITQVAATSSSGIVSLTLIGYDL